MKRVKKVLRAFKLYKIDSFLISSSSNIRYLLGIHDVEGFLFLSPEECVLFTDGRYVKEVSRIAPSYLRLVCVKGGFMKSLKSFLRRTKAHRVGIEASHMSVSMYAKIRDYFSGQKDIVFVRTVNMVEKIRQIKSPIEISYIKKSTNITKECVSYVREILLSKSMSECDISCEIDRFFKIKAGESAFSPIVAFDAYTSEPHHRPKREKTPLKRLFLVDLGAKYSGYCSDLTRVFIRDRIPLVKKIYDIVRCAQARAIRAIKPGRKISAVDKAARTYIESKGYGRFFSHSLGHGIGVDVHELPYVSQSNSECLQENMVFTVEPAIYLPNKFGIRLEEVVRVTNEGCSVISC